MYMNFLLQENEFNLDKPFSWKYELRKWHCLDRIDYILDFRWTTEQKKTIINGIPVYESRQKIIVIEELNDTQAIKKALELVEELKKEFTPIHKSTKIYTPDPSCYGKLVEIGEVKRRL